MWREPVAMLSNRKVRASRRSSGNERRAVYVERGGDPVRRTGGYGGWRDARRCFGIHLEGGQPERGTAGIQAVANREVIIGPSIARRVMGLFSTERSQTPQAFPKLTEREREILVMITQGRNHAEISAELFLSLKTAQNHVSNIFRKLQVA